MVFFYDKSSTEIKYEYGALVGTTKNSRETYRSAILFTTNLIMSVLRKESGPAVLRDRPPTASPLTQPFKEQNQSTFHIRIILFVRYRERCWFHYKDQSVHIAHIVQ